MHSEIERTDYDGTYRLAGQGRSWPRSVAPANARLSSLPSGHCLRCGAAAAQPARQRRAELGFRRLAIAEAVASLAGSAESGTTEKASDEEVNRARRLYADDNVQIDDGAGASRGDGITWVQAWVALEEQHHE